MGWTGCRGRGYLLPGGGGELGGRCAAGAAGYFVFVQEGVALPLRLGRVGGAQGLQAAGGAPAVQGGAGEAPVGRALVEAPGAAAAVRQRVVLPRELDITGGNHVTLPLLTPCEGRSH